MVDTVGRAKDVSTKVTGSNPVLTTNFRINYPKTGRFETSDWL